MILVPPHGNPIFQVVGTIFAERDAKGYSFTLILLSLVKWSQTQWRVLPIPELAIQRSWMPEDSPSSSLCWDWSSCCHVYSFWYLLNLHGWPKELLACTKNSPNINLFLVLRPGLFLQFIFNFFLQWDQKTTCTPLCCSPKSVCFIAKL